MKRLAYVLTVVAIAIVAIGATALLVVALTTNEDGGPSYRLSAETMIPLDSPSYPTELSCPEGASASPVDFSPVGRLAEELPVYEGELIAVRITTAPFAGPLPESVAFEATWPQEIVTGAPQCAFVLDTGNGNGTPASLSWEPVGAGAAFTIDGYSPTSAATIEVWLTAAEPVPRTEFSTSLTTSETGDRIVVEPLGGRVTMDQRLGVSAELTLEQSAPIVEGGQFEITAVVVNPTASSRVLDASLELEATSDVTWSPASAVDPETCRQEETKLVCPLGDISASSDLVVTVTGQLPAGWLPEPVSCPTDGSSGGVGLCVTASVASDGISVPQYPLERVVVQAPPPEAGPLVIRSEFDPVVVRAGQNARVPLLLSTSLPDLAAVEVVDSDCAEIVRVESSLDDGDAFLNPGETWRYVCDVQLFESKVIRVDVAARGGGLESVSSSARIAAVVIDPELSVSTTEGVGSNGTDGTIFVTLANSGVGDLTNVAVNLPGCDRLILVAGSTQPLLQGEAAQFECVSSEVGIDTELVTAYATDAAGLPVLGAR